MVDDDPDIRELIALTLAELYGCTVTVSQSGDDALTRLRSGAVRPDLILLDLQMPGMGGAEVLRELKSRGASRHIPVVLLTGSQDPHGLRVARTLLKPIDIEQLGELLESVAAAKPPSLDDKVSAIRARFLRGARETVAGWAERSEEDIRADAHRLAGTAGQLDLQEMADLFQAIERDVGTRSVAAEIEALRTQLSDDAPIEPSPF